MIERYSLPEMEQVWSQDTRLELWYKIEVAVAEAMAEMSIIPPQVVERFHGSIRINRQRMEEIEAEVHHDVIAFLTMISEQVGEEGRYLHLGLTSSDILDTTLGLQFSQSLALLDQKIGNLLDTLHRQAHTYKMTPIMGRSHGIHAEPTTFGLKLALWFEELKRHRERLSEAAPRLKVGKISGPVGNYSLIEPAVEELVCAKLELQPARISSQIIQRDRHAEYLNLLALLASSLDKFATEIRGLQKTECREVEEPFRRGQKGSSAMPHKRNPILCERVSGLSRIVRGNAIAGMENIPLWHERDISHSSVERIILPDSSLAVYYMLHLMDYVIGNLTVFPEQMRKNIESTNGLFYSQRIMLELVLRGLSRENAYRMVQRNAMKCWQTKEHLRDLICKDEEITSIIDTEILRNLFTMDLYFNHVDTIFTRVFHDSDSTQ